MRVRQRPVTAPRRVSFGFAKKIPYTSFDEFRNVSRAGSLALQQTLEQHVLLVSTVAGDARIDDSDGGQVRPQTLGKPLLGLDINSIQQRIAEKQDRRSGARNGFNVAQAKAVMTRGDRSRRIHMRNRVGGPNPTQGPDRNDSRASGRSRPGVFAADRKPSARIRLAPALPPH